jgi:cardiolipin synthase
MHEVAKSSKEIVDTRFRWLRTGGEALREMLDAINVAEHSVRLEMYIFHPSPIADEFRDALIAACQRGARVKVLLDAFGSIALSETFWSEFKQVGGELRWFNPLKLKRFGVRDHRKVLVCDQRVAFIGGLNISTEYQGDGVTSGWRDLGMKICGPLAEALAQSVDQMFTISDFKPKRFQRLRRSAHQRMVTVPNAELLLSAPGRQRNPIKKAIIADLKKARSVQIICAYFLPTWRIRRELVRIAKTGGKVQLILPGKSDVVLSQLASRSLYRRFMQAGVKIYEYSPQILHAKLFIIDNVVYAGSANLDFRSLHLNYELLVRIDDKEFAQEAREMFLADLLHCEKLDLAEWRKSRDFWTRLKQRWAYTILARLDPFITRWQLKLLR